MSAFLTMPYSLDIAGVDMKINPCFRNVLKLQSMFYEKALDEDLKRDIFIYNLYTEMQKDDFSKLAFMDINIKAHLVDRGNWFMACGNEKESKPKKPVLDTEQDWPYIVPAFLTMGKNLMDPNLEMHWWEFQARIQELPKECHLVRIMHLRTLKNEGKLDKKDYKSEREEYNKLGVDVMVIRRFALEKPKTHDERMKMIAAISQSYIDEAAKKAGER